MVAGFGREGEQVCPQGRPSGFVGESGHELVGSVERLHNLGSDELFRRRRAGRRCSAGPPGGAGPPDRGSRSTVVAETGASSRARICCRLGRGAG